MMEQIAQDIAWCPGCGNFTVKKIVEQVLQQLELRPQDTVMVSGIGQAAKSPQYLHLNMFNGLHGRALPAATAIKTANPRLTVIVESGDGDMYGEGGNHLLHAMRRNSDVTAIVHDNRIYGLTKGQASPTTPQGMKTSLQTEGVTTRPFSPLSVALSAGATFVSQASVCDREGAVDTLLRAIRHRGFSLVNMFQPCVTFNHINTFGWFKENSERIPEDHDPSDFDAAWALVRRDGPLPLGVLYQDTSRKSFEEAMYEYSGIEEPIAERKPDREKVAALLDSFR
jgi:2-oxoglutarate ferredoxin oxidoreductase subunit beta